jgi:hypothetical protein
LTPLGIDWREKFLRIAEQKMIGVIEAVRAGQTALKG